jgi:endonuclease/exonuclease/phosphatase family metal-dependent hydrolase
MRIASFNLENLFSRARALMGDMEAGPNSILQAFAEFNERTEKSVYSDADKTRFLEIIKLMGLEKSDIGEFAILRQNRGKFLKRPLDGVPVIVASGRADWMGWLELATVAVNELAIRHTAQVVHDVKPDVIAVIEVENRIALSRFNDTLLKAAGLRHFDHLMVIDGNDARGIDVGVMTRNRYAIGSMTSHVDDPLPGSRGKEKLFSRDCPVYEILGTGGQRLLLLVNHFKSKSGLPGPANAKREAQAKRVRRIYLDLVASGEKNIAVVGDLNDYPGSRPLSSLISTDLKDISELANFDDGGFPGTYGGSTASNKIDYILLSPALQAKVKGGGIFRKGMWPGTRPRKWEIYPTLTKAIEAASDHGAIFVDLNL